MGRYSGWVIAGVVCLIIITLAVTGIINFSPATAPTSSTSQALVNPLKVLTNGTNSLIANIPLRMVA